jgi:hypothetical protein
VIGGLLSMAMTVAMVVGIVRLASGHQPGTPVDLRETVARGVRLLLLLSVVVMTAEGVAGLIGELRIGGGGDLVRDPTTFARSAAFCIVGAPVLLGLGSWTRRRLRTDPDEVRSGGWGAYLAVATTLALVMAAASGFEVVRWTLGGQAPGTTAVGRVLVWTPVWILHWRLAGQHPTAPGRLPFHLLAGSAFGLALVGVGSGLLLASALRTLYDGAFLDPMIRPAARDLSENAAAALVGAAVWAWHWLMHARRRRDTTGWHGLVLLVGVLGSLITAVVGAARVLHAVLQWTLGDPGDAAAAAHFIALPSALATAVVGTAGWAYHRSVLGGRGPAAGPSRDDVARVHDYLSAAVGLVVTAVAAAMAVAALFERAAGAAVVHRRADVANLLVLAATLALVGVPVWWRAWGAAEREAAADPSELSSVPRRVFIFLLLGAGAAAALVTAVITTVILVEALTTGRLGRITAHRVRIPAAVLLATAAVAGQHVRILRRDRAAEPVRAPAAAPVRATFVIPGTDAARRAAAEAVAALGPAARVTVRVVDGDTGPGPTAAALAAAVEAHRAEDPSCRHEFLVVAVTDQPLLALPTG